MPKKDRIQNGKRYLNMIVQEETIEKLHSLQSPMSDEMYKETGMRVRFSVGMVIDRLMRDYKEKKS